MRVRASFHSGPSPPRLRKRTCPDKGLKNAIDRKRSRMEAHSTEDPNTVTDQQRKPFVLDLEAFENELNSLEMSSMLS
jgi:hypothetical protein